MKKRKELDALVANGKTRKKSGSFSSQELLRNESDTTDTEDFSVLHPRKSILGSSGGAASRLCTVYLPLCMLTLLTACAVGSGMLVWMHFGLRQEVDMLRKYVKAVEAGTRGTPEEFHTIHSQLKDLDQNASSMRDDIMKIVTDINILKKDIDSLKQTTQNLQESIAAAPQLKTLPKDVLSLKESVATMGSKISDFETTTKEMKDANNKLNQQLQNSMETLQGKVQNMSTTSQTATIPAPFALTEEFQRLGVAVDDLNKTLGNKMQFALNDLHEHHIQISTLHNTTDNLTTEMGVLEAKVNKNIGNTLELENLVQDEVSHSIQQVTGIGSETVTNGNITMQQLLSYIGNLTAIYEAVLMKSPRTEADSPIFNKTLLNLNVKQALEEIVRDTLQSVDEKQQRTVQGLGEQVTQLSQLLDQLNNDQITTSTQLHNLTTLVHEIQSNMHQHKTNEDFLNMASKTAVPHTSMISNTGASAFDSGTSSVRTRTLAINNTNKGRSNFQNDTGS